MTLQINLKQLSLMLFLASFFCFCWLSYTTQAQDTKPTAKDGGVIFKIPDGYGAVDFPDKEIKGVMMINFKRPSGMFVFYPKEMVTLAELAQKVRPSFARMFIHDEKAQLTWSESALPAHEKAPDETGLLSATEKGDMEIQVATYLRQVRGRNVAYGYFAMRHKKPKGDDAKFMDAAGKGAKDFDKLLKTLQ